MFCVVLHKFRAKMSHQISAINIQDHFCMKIGLSFWNRAIPKMSWIKGVPGQVGPCQDNDIEQVFNIFTPKFSTKIVWHISGRTFARGLARGHGKSCHTKAFPGRVTLIACQNNIMSGFSRFSLKKFPTKLVPSISRTSFAWGHWSK